MKNKNMETKSSKSIKEVASAHIFRTKLQWTHVMKRIAMKTKYRHNNIVIS